ncbi:mitotic cyclin [Trypanosoma theileri]|uniref:Mitotic cyclin n=1 Tax=Trypanosoma theileri TaxID=67003 RepID=A0A1X0NSJ1_9TRYP|nr:mitotic cyclin [Trypanosoma theileri]ORC87657.1 mitotic cyclin [Trypanosoma theileri]
MDLDSMNDNTNNNNSTLQALDINVQQYAKSELLALPIPRQLRSSISGQQQQQEQYEQRQQQRYLGFSDAFMRTTSPLSYGEVRSELINVLLQLEIRHGCACYSGTGASVAVEDCRRVLECALSRLLLSASESTRRLLAAVVGGGPLSLRAAGVLRHRRRQLTAGLDGGAADVQTAGLDGGAADVQTAARLALLLGETAEMPQLLRRHTTDATRRRVEDLLFLHPTDTVALCHAVLQMPVPQQVETPFDAHYYNDVVDDLIAMGDEEPQSGLLQSVQRDITPQVRELHTEWMLQVAMACNVKLETFFLAVAILDRYLLRIYVQRDQLQLVGCAALLLASKQEEIFPISLRTLVRYGADRFTLEALVAAECQLFSFLGFDVVLPTLSAVGLGLLLLQESTPSEKQKCFLLYTLATLSIRTYYRQFKLSSLAATAVYLSRYCFNIPSGRPSEEVAALLPIVTAALCRNSAMGPGGIYDIFGRSVFHEVSRIKLPEM